MFAIAVKSLGRGSPRWSVTSPNAEPASIAGLPVAGASVRVGPPLAASASSSGFAFDGEPVIVPSSSATLSSSRCSYP